MDKTTSAGVGSGVQRELPSGKEAAPAAKPEAWDDSVPATGEASARSSGSAAPFLEALDRKTALRALLLTLLSGVCGYLLTGAFLGTDPAILAVAAHRPSAGLDPWLFWLRLCLSALPAWIMLCISGLCCFGSALASLTLGFCGLCDGAALSALALAASFGDITSGDAVAAGGRLIPPFLLYTLLLWAARVMLFQFIKATSDGLSDPATQLCAGQRGLSPLILRHLAVCLATCLLGMAAAGIYTGWMYSLL